MTSSPPEQFPPYYAKAAESWAAARAEFNALRFNAAVALAYYACFQLGLAAHIGDGLPGSARRPLYPPADLANH